MLALAQGDAAASRSPRMGGPGSWRDRDARPSGTVANQILREAAEGDLPAPTPQVGPSRRPLRAVRCVLRSSFSPGAQPSGIPLLGREPPQLMCSRTVRLPVHQDPPESIGPRAGGEALLESVTVTVNDPGTPRAAMRAHPSRCPGNRRGCAR